MAHSLVEVAEVAMQLQVPGRRMEGVHSWKVVHGQVEDFHSVDPHRASMFQNSTAVASSQLEAHCCDMAVHHRRATRHRS